ncbi:MULTISPECIES: hypothetical protein [unclassified Mesorhizobium]|uniref:hypothetical protein n=1 Tax=unclassified Mesorhizobium TaxID=325217 RepID=UPI000FCC99E9|nr:MULTISPECIES: hypothetical protein [unclassified Mesorhizobium]RUX97163.1 hypothetical protein EN993_05035 [Mesorhizobium sp. M7D.F.Ca.US.004.01.2.1]RVA31031.1 hypothetical protein EN935_14120 [Mesorhizobium sp. M7D.F.Ca.US.004.03.1.1]
MTLPALEDRPRREAALEIMRKVGAAPALAPTIAGISEAARNAVAAGYRDVSVQIESLPDGSAKLSFRAVR